MRSAALLLAVGTLALAAGCGGGDDEGGARAAVPGFRVLERVALPTRPGGIAAGEGAVWATNPERGELIRVDPETGQVAATHRVARAATGVAAGGGSVWVVDPVSSTVVRVDPASGEERATIPLSNPAEIVFGFGSLWAVEGAAVTRVDARTNEVVARIATPGPATSLAVGTDAVWAVGRRDFDVIRIDPETNRRAATIDLGESVGAGWIGATPGATWTSATSPQQAGLARIDARTNRVLGLLPLPRRRYPVLGRVVGDDRALWFVSAVDVGRVEPRTNRVVARVNASSFRRRTPGSPRYADLGAAAVLDGDLWVADPSQPALVRVGRGA